MNLLSHCLRSEVWPRALGFLLRVSAGLNSTRWPGCALSWRLWAKASTSVIIQCTSQVQTLRLWFQAACVCWLSARGLFLFLEVACFPCRVTSPWRDTHTSNPCPPRFESALPGGTWVPLKRLA